MLGFTYCSPSHEPFLNDWLQPTLPADIELSVHRDEQVCDGGSYYKSGWNTMGSRWAAQLVDVIAAHRDEWLLVMDVDIQFFVPELSPYLEPYTQQTASDFVFQHTHPSRTKCRYCTGFFLVRATTVAESVFSQLVAGSIKYHDDQKGFNEIVKQRKIPVHLLDPDQFWSPWGGWKPESPMEPPTSIVMHHANWTIGIENKLQQLAHVRKVVEARCDS